VVISRQMVPRQNLYAYSCLWRKLWCVYFEGGFSEYEENKKKRLGGDLTKTFEIQKTNQKLILVLYNKKRMSITASFFVGFKLYLKWFRWNRV
jgi:hypothetical protein